MKIGWFVCVLNSLPGRMRKMPWASTLNKPLTRGGSRNSGVDPALSKSKSATMWTTCYQPAWGLQGWFRLISLKLRFDFSFCFQSSCFVFLVCDFTLVCLDNDVNFFSFFFFYLSCQEMIRHKQHYTFGIVKQLIPKLWALNRCYNEVLGIISTWFWDLAAGICSHSVTRALVWSASDVWSLGRTHAWYSTSSVGLKFYAVVHQTGMS